VFYNYAIVTRTVGGLWAHLDPRLEERPHAGGRPLAHVPRGHPAAAAAGPFAAATSLVFLFTFTSFGVILILGGLRYATIEVEIWRQTAAYLDLPMAAALAVVQMVAGDRHPAGLLALPGTADGRARAAAGWRDRPAAAHSAGVGLRRRHPALGGLYLGALCWCW